MYFKMVSSFLCIFALFALPSVLAISCYQCLSQPPNTTCTSGNINITDCGPEELYACMKTTIELMSMGEQTLTMNTMKCIEKARCETPTREACNITYEGMTIKNCTASCCCEDKCNGINGGSESECYVDKTSAPTSNATSKGSSNVASFIAKVMSVTALFAHFFIH